MLGGRRRNAMEVAANILEEARLGINKTRLVYRTNLNHLLIQRYIDVLIDKNLLEVVPNPHPIYRTTPKGIGLLNEFSKISQMLGVNELSA
jgi:predicted transcriptional regulator